MRNRVSGDVENGDFYKLRVKPLFLVNSLMRTIRLKVRSLRNEGVCVTCSSYHRSVQVSQVYSRLSFHSKLDIREEGSIPTKIHI